jgi:hypothetical protein
MKFIYKLLQTGNRIRQGTIIHKDLSPEILAWAARWCHYWGAETAYSFIAPLFLSDKLKKKIYYNHKSYYMCP